MALTRAQMVVEICDVVGKSAAAASVSGALLADRAVNYLNWGQRRIARHYDFYELNALSLIATTVTSIKTYPLSDGTNNLGLARIKDIGSIRLIDGASSLKLDRWQYRKFDHHFPYPENYSTARPYIYTRWANNLEFFRIPNAVYTLHIRYSLWPQELTSDAQVSDYTNKDELLVTAGVLEAYLALQEYADVKVWWEKFIGLLKDGVEAEGDVDWEPEAEPHNMNAGYHSGEPWLDPYGESGDPLHGYD